MVIVVTSEETAPTAPKDTVTVDPRTVEVRATIDVRARPARTGPADRAVVRGSGVIAMIDVETTVDPTARTAGATTTAANVATTIEASGAATTDASSQGGAETTAVGPGVGPGVGEARADSARRAVAKRSVRSVAMPGRTSPTSRTRSRPASSIPPSVATC